MIPFISRKITPGQITSLPGNKWSFMPKGRISFDRISETGYFFPNFSKLLRENGREGEWE
jgi:hypothetical protein